MYIYVISTNNYFLLNKQGLVPYYLFIEIK